MTSFEELVLSKGRIPSIILILLVPTVFTVLVYSQPSCWWQVLPFLRRPRRRQEWTGEVTTCRGRAV